MSRENLLHEFILDAFEILEKAERDILSLENIIESTGKNDPDKLNDIFRAFHTLKGSAGMLKLSAVVAVTHEAESLLDILRNDASLEFNCGEELISVIDFLRNLLQTVSDSGKEPKSVKKVNEFRKRLSLIIESLQSKANDKDTSSEPKATFGFFDDEPASQQPETTSMLIAPETEAEDAEDAVGKTGDARKKDIRVPTERLDQLLDLVGELVIAEAGVVSHPELANLKLDGFRRAARHLQKIVRDIQEITLLTRMVPISGVFQRLVRLVRDLQKISGKKVNLVVEGEETEVDKSVVDLISDPLIHILRNAIDHGLETSEERLAAEKPQEGEIFLKAVQSANEVWISIKDDGRGLDREKIIAKARQKGFIETDGTDMSDAEVFRLIFLPGFSTAEQVSEISGRGVGMDIAKANIDQLNGRIDIRSEKGRGTMFTIRIPLRLGIMEGTNIRIGNSFFTLQTIEIRELVDLAGRKQFEIYEECSVIDVRGRHIPLMQINEILNLPGYLEGKSANPLMVVLEYDDSFIGLKVDEVLGNQNVIVKSSSGMMRQSQGVSGFTILGNGQVSIILDVKSIFQVFAQKAHEIQTQTGRSISELIHEKTGRESVLSV